MNTRHLSDMTITGFFVFGLIEAYWNMVLKFLILC